MQALLSFIVDAIILFLKLREVKNTKSFSFPLLNNVDNKNKSSYYFSE